MKFVMFLVGLLVVFVLGFLISADRKKIKYKPIAIMLIMRMGTILDSGFDQIFNLYSPATYDVADVLDTYVYRMGVQGYQYGFSTAVGLFKSVVGIIMVLVTNTISKKLSEGEISI